MYPWIFRCRAAMRRWLPAILVLSLGLNLLLVGGFLYQHLIVQPRQQTAWAVQALHLDARQQAELRQLHSWSHNSIRQSMEELQPDISVVRRMLREGNADDPALRLAMQHLSERRLDLQMQSLERVFAFRDSLDVEQRQIFNRLTEQRGFVLRLLGLGPKGKDQLAQ